MALHDFVAGQDKLDARGCSSRCDQRHVAGAGHSGHSGRNPQRDPRWAVRRPVRKTAPADGEKRPV